MIDMDTVTRVRTLWQEKWAYKYIAQMTGLTFNQVHSLIRSRFRRPKGTRGEDISQSNCHEIARAYYQHPEWTWDQLANHCNITRSTAQRIVRKYAPEDYKQRQEEKEKKRLDF